MANRKRRVVPEMDWSADDRKSGDADSSRRGRPPKHSQEEDFRSTTIRLRVSDYWYLDDLVTGIKRRGGDQTLTRSELLRGLLSAVRESGIDLSAARDERSIAATLLAHMQSAT